MKAVSRRSAFRYAPYVRMAAKAGRFVATQATRAYVGSKVNQLFNRGSSGVQTTNQYDVRKQYRYKKMPRRKKRMWKKFVRKSKAVTLSLLGSRTQLRNTQLQQSVPIIDQTVYKLHLYGKAGTDIAGIEAGTNDCQSIVDTDLLVSTVRNWQMYFQSAVLDMTIRANGGGGVELDIYEVGYFDTTKEANLTGVYNASFARSSNTAGAGANDANRIQITTRGATLFDLPEFTKAGVKIYKKTKVFLGAGQTTTFQTRDPRTHRFTNEDEEDDTGFIKLGMTRSVVVIAKQLPGATESTNLVMGVTRKYMYKIMEAKSTATNVA